MNTYDKHMKQYAKVPGTRAGPGVRYAACTALGTMDPALGQKAKADFVPECTAATKDPNESALHPRR